MNRKADLIGRFTNDLDRDESGGCGSVAGIARISKGLGDEGERAARQMQHRHNAVAILDTGGLRVEHEAAPLRVHHDLSLAALHLLGGIIAARAATLGCLHAPAVENSRARRRVAPDAFTVSHDQVMIDPHEHAGITPAGEVAEHRALWRQVLGRQPPGNATTQNVEDPAEDFPHRPDRWPTAAGGIGQQRSDDRPLGIRQIGFISQPAMLTARAIVDAGDLGPLLYIRGRYGHGGRPGYDKEWRCRREISGGGELIDQGSHLTDMSRWFLGDFPHVFGMAPTYFWDVDVDDDCFVGLKTAAGQVAWLHASWTEWKTCSRSRSSDATGSCRSTGLAVRTGPSASRTTACCPAWVRPGNGSGAAKPLAPCASLINAVAGSTWALLEDDACIDNVRYDHHARQADGLRQ